jgi:hypothetical protein
MSRATILLVCVWIAASLLNLGIQSVSSLDSTNPLAPASIGFSVALSALALVFLVNHGRVARLGAQNEPVEFAIRPVSAIFCGLAVFLALTGFKAIILLAKGELDQNFGEGLGNLPVTAIVIGIYLTAYRHPQT